MIWGMSWVEINQRPEGGLAIHEERTWTDQHI
jgi:hypothetical protein